jgi:tRNA A37 threonylcarbamoyladenosine dehydratase
MLARSGVGRLRLIDFDQVTVSSLNRHAVATLDDVGTSKVQCMKKYLAKVVRHCEVEAVVALFRKEVGESLLEGAPDYVLDCIDNVDTKVDLLELCVRMGIPVISAMGAGLKADPSKVRVGDISETLVDPLSRATRRALAKRGIERGVRVVYSVEKPRGELLPMANSQEADDYRPVEEVKMRVRILPVLGTQPALFGNATASVVLLDLASLPLLSDPPLRGRTQFYLKLYKRLKEKVGNEAPDYDQAIAEKIVEDVWRGRCAKTGNSLTLTLTRFDRYHPSPTSTYIHHTSYIICLDCIFFFFSV